MERSKDVINAVEIRSPSPLDLICTSNLPMDVDREEGARVLET